MSSATHAAGSWSASGAVWGRPPSGRGPSAGRRARRRRGRDVRRCCRGGRVHRSARPSLRRWSRTPRVGLVEDEPRLPRPGGAGAVAALHPSGVPRPVVVGDRAIGVGVEPGLVDQHADAVGVQPLGLPRQEPVRVRGCLHRQVAGDRVRPHGRGAPGPAGPSPVPTSAAAGGRGRGRRPRARARPRARDAARPRAPSPRTPPPPVCPGLRSGRHARRTSPPRRTRAWGCCPSASRPPGHRRMRRACGRGPSPTPTPAPRRPHAGARSSLPPRGPAQSGWGPGCSDLRQWWWTWDKSPRPHRQPDLREHICGEPFRRCDRPGC